MSNRFRHLKPEHCSLMRNYQNLSNSSCVDRLYSTCESRTFLAQKRSENSCEVEFKGLVQIWGKNIEQSNFVLVQCSRLLLLSSYFVGVFLFFSSIDCTIFILLIFDWTKQNFRLGVHSETWYPVKHSRFCSSWCVWLPFTTIYVKLCDCFTKLEYFSYENIIFMLWKQRYEK